MYTMCVPINYHDPERAKSQTGYGSYSSKSILNNNDDDTFVCVFNSSSQTTCCPGGSAEEGPGVDMEKTRDDENRMKQSVVD